MKRQGQKYDVSSFSILTTFTVLVIMGLAFLPKVQTRLLPNRYQPAIYVSFAMRGANAIVVDNEVTSKLEGAFSRIGGLQKLESRTRSGGGALTLQMDKGVTGPGRVSFIAEEKRRKNYKISLLTCSTQDQTL